MRQLNWIVAITASLSPAWVLADEPASRPDGNQKVIVQVQPGEHAMAPHRESPTREKGPYLGVSTSPAPAVLRKQLGLPAGMGLVVDFVVPDSPAGRAGLRQYDVLQKFDDQLIVNPPQLAVLVRSHQPGDEVKLSVIRDGKLTALSAKLVEHDLEPLAEEDGNEMAGRAPGMLGDPHFMLMRPDADIRGSAGAWHGPGGEHSTTLTWIEDGRSYTVVTINGHKTFTARDKDGKIVFEGPVDTQEQRDKLPAGQKEKLDHMEQHLHSATGGALWEAEPGAATQPAPDRKDAGEK